jgi:hypothetical protein
MEKYPKIEITREELIRTIYFILMKYNIDSLHLQGTSSKRDLIGGFIERWLNKLAETAVFDNLLLTKPYEAVPDYFLYNNESDKNAPDILGIKDKNKIIAFSQYNNGTWERVGNRPRIEVKAWRKDQYLLGVREPQMIDDYYVFVESDLSPDYLTSIFEEDVFDKKNLELLRANYFFIKSDKNKSIIFHSEPKKAETIGSFRLMGTYTKEQVVKNTVLCCSGISPMYPKKIKNVQRVVRANENEKLCINNNKLVYDLNEKIYLPIAIEGDSQKARIVKKNKGSLYLKTEVPLVINRTNLSPGFIKIEYVEFSRSSSWNENIATKIVFEMFAEDSTQEMLEIFDKIYQNSNPQ